MCFEYFFFLGVRSLFDLLLNSKSFSKGDMGDDLETKVNGVSLLHWKV